MFEVDIVWLEEHGFEFIDDDTDPHYELVLDEKNWVESDYIYTEKSSMGKYKLIQYNKGVNNRLSHWEYQQLRGTPDFTKAV